MATTYIYRNIIHLNIRSNGKQIRKSTGLKNNKENMLKVQMEILPLFIANIDGPSTDVKVSYYVNRFLEEKKHIVKSVTYYRYERIIKRWIIPFYGERKVITIRASVVKDYVNNQYNLAKTPKSVEQYITTFRGILQEAVYDGILSSNPFESIKRRKKEKPIVTPFSKEEVNLLLENTTGWFQNYIGLAVNTGLRSGELLGLKWSDIDDKYIKIRRTRDKEDSTPKTASSNRDIPIFECIKKFINNQRLLTGNMEYVFVTSSNLPWSDTQWICKFYWYPLLEKLDLKKRRPYEMRHTFATNMLNSGYFKVTEIAHLLGHTTTEYLFNVYSRYIASEKDNLPLDKEIY